MEGHRDKYGRYGACFPRRKYCLIEHKSNKIDPIKFQYRKKNFTENTSVDRKQPIHKAKYHINPPNDHILEVCVTKRLPFEPKGWHLELRNTIKSHLKKLRGDGVILQAIYKSIDPAFFDVEKVLFYNVGTSAFSHVLIKTLQTSFYLASHKNRFNKNS